MAQGRTRLPPFRGAERNFARAMDRIVVSTRELDFDELCRRFRAVEATALAEVGDDAALALELRRRVAERIFYASLDKDLPAQRCRDFLSAIEALGYTDLQLQAQVYIIYARHCLRTGERAEGVRVLEALRLALEVEISRTRRTQRRRLMFWRGLMQTSDDVLTKLHSGTAPG